MVNYYLQRVSLTFRIADAMEVVPRTAELACAALTPTADSNSGLQQRVRSRWKDSRSHQQAHRSRPQPCTRTKLWKLSARLDPIIAIS